MTEREKAIAGRLKGALPTAFPATAFPATAATAASTAGNAAVNAAGAASGPVVCASARPPCTLPQANAFAHWLPVLRACDLFIGHADAQILSLMPCFQARVHEYRKGEAIAIAGEAQDVFGIVLSGEILVQKEDYAGNRLIIGIFTPSEIFGEVSVYAGATRWPNTVQANTACSALFLSYAKVSQPCCNVCQSHQLLITNMLGIIARKALNMNSRISYLKLRGMREKLAAYLYEQYMMNGSRNFMLPMNREQLADYLNVSRPSMSRELGRMRDEGVIDFFRSSFTIKDIAGLRRMH